MGQHAIISLYKQNLSLSATSTREPPTAWKFYFLAKMFFYILVTNIWINENYPKVKLFINSIFPPNSSEYI